MSEHRRAVRAAFDRAATSYDQAATVQREICQILAEMVALETVDAPPGRVLDAGCGTGFGLPHLRRLFPGAHCLAVDFAPAMLGQLQAGAQGLCADLHALPLASGAIDAVWSSLALQWCQPLQSLTEIARVLRPGGRAWLATLGPGTLGELRTAFAQVDGADHVIAFHDPAHWARSAQQAGLGVAALEERVCFATAPALGPLLRDIKAVGAHQVGPGRRHLPMGKSAWRQLESAYEPFRRADGLLPATYHVILLALVKPLNPP